MRKITSILSVVFVFFALTGGAMAASPDSSGLLGDNFRIWFPIPVITIFIFTVMFASVFLFYNPKINLFINPKLIALKCCSVALMLVWLVSLIQNKLKTIPRHVWIAAGSYVAWMAFTSYFAGDQSAAINGSYGRFTGLSTQIIFVSLFIMAATLPLTHTDIKKVLMTLIICMIPVAIIAMIGYPSISFAATGIRNRFGSTIGNPVILAALISIACPFILYFFATATGKRRKGWAILFGLFMVTILMAWSRGPILGFCVSMAIMVYSMVSVSRRSALRITIGMGVLATAFYVANLSAFPDGRFKSWSIEAYQSRSFNDRNNLAHASMSMIADNPVMGIGMGNFKDEHAKYLPEKKYKNYREAHNVYLDMAVSLGIPGLALYLALVGSVLSCLIRVRSRGRDDGPRGLGIRIAFIAAIADVMIQDVTGWQHIALTPILFIILGLGVSISNGGSKNAVCQDQG